MFLPEEVQLPGKTAVSDLSSLSDFSDKPVVRALQDATGKTHYLVKYDVTRDPSGRCRTKNESARSVWKETKEEMLASIVSLAGKLQLLQQCWRQGLFQRPRSRSEEGDKSYSP
jgi:hypothetical protein